MGGEEGEGVLAEGRPRGDLAEEGERNGVGRSSRSCESLKRGGGMVEVKGHAVIVGVAEVKGHTVMVGVAPWALHPGEVWLLCAHHEQVL